MDHNDCNSDGSATEAECYFTNLEGSLSTDAILELLTHPYRRAILQYLIDASDETATIDGVTTHLVDRESRQSDDRSDRDRLEIAIIHIHLPMLSEKGIVEYDVRSREIRYRRHEGLEALLGCLRALDST
ncbi:hypothetical protein Htur_4192 (plasmid) [Haloterrigena turkmenica DSM 5511]|uniref:DUF7344 domain-containing protein n=1 Tax=Haloterrigena turkmenica (strain ATCC 51198 / DSM 5511 / JCM 9101 / NCIMB 13204 / VKM B-1734 / 4k) TaxID=543526 RepID=D2S0W7_HALTV|nr:hypothetical protein [Haloterrigena turkmenica]ADB63014.1 hypothetical protein Htur_4192 [Haloterrigena turkmenica DSM 5511]